MTAGFPCRHGTPDDPILTLVARRCGMPRGTVVMVWWYVLNHAVRAAIPGSIQDMRIDVTSIALDQPEADINTILAAARECGLLDSDDIAGWVDETTSTARVRRHRQRKRGETPTVLHETLHETPMKRDETQDETQDALHETAHDVSCNAPPAHMSATRAGSYTQVSNNISLTTNDVAKPPGASEDAKAVASSFGSLRSEFWPNDPSFGAPLMTLHSQAQEWLGQGLSPDEITAVMRRACEVKRQRGDGPPTCLGFVRRSLQSAVARLQPAGQEGEGASPAGAAQMPPNEAQWRSRLSLWLKGIDWQWGVAPDRPGTKVPRGLLDEFADAIRQRDAKVEAR